MRTAKVIRLLKQYQPRTAQEILDWCGLPLQYIGGGAFRDTYHVIGTPLVIKVPRKSRVARRAKANVQHARDEYAIWTRVKRSRQKFKQFQKYVPDLIYFNSATGVIVMRKYEQLRYSRANNVLILELERAITKIMKTELADIHYGNLGADSRGKVKIIDMGLFIAGKV